MSGRSLNLSFDLDVCFTLGYPVVLRFTWKGEKVSFIDPQKAMELLSEMEGELTEASSSQSWNGRHG